MRKDNVFCGKNILNGRKSPASNAKKPLRFHFRSGFDQKLVFGYPVTRSSHLSMASIVNIESKQATTKTVQVIQIGICS